MVFDPVFPRTLLPGFGPGLAAAAPWWQVSGKTCVIAYQPKGAASQAASYSNLANPGTYDAAAGSVPTWASGTGWTFNGSSQYLTTGWTVSSTSVTAICRFSGGGTTGDPILLGAVSSGSKRLYLCTYDSSGRGVGYGNDYRVYVTPGITSGVLAVAGNQGYRNGSADGGTISPNSTAAGLTVYVGCYNGAGSPQYYFTGNILAVAIYSAVLTSGEVSALTTRMNAL